MRQSKLIAVFFAAMSVPGWHARAQLVAPVVVTGPEGSTLTAPAMTLRSGDRITSHELSAIDKIHQEIRHIDSQVQSLLGEYNKSPNDAKRTEVTAELTKVIDQQFTVRQKVRAAEIEELEAQLKKLKEVHEQRNQQKTRIVKDRVDQLLRDASGLGWGSTSAEMPHNLKFSGLFSGSEDPVRVYSRTDVFNRPADVSRP